MGDRDAAGLIRRRRDELRSKLAVLSEALRRLMEIEEEAEQHQHHAAAAGDMAAAGTHHSDDPVAAMAAAADDHRSAPDDYDLSWLEYATSEPGDEEDATRLAGYQENDDDDGPVHQAIATGRLYVPRIQSTSASLLDSDVQAAYAGYHHGGRGDSGGGAPAFAFDGDDDSPYPFAAGDDPSSDAPEHPMRHLEHHMHDHQDFSRAFGGGPELTPFRSSDGSFGSVPASATAIAALRKQRYDGTGAGSGCVICFRDFKQGRRLAVMPCTYGHRFHRKCLRKWLKSSHVCPLCRYALPTE
ncbi:hypothetical protein BS78_05G048200 [Paspalum vaginatum]|nr:hypothetical protein BS78_05G048200 [Paspalum vaginatum]